jgi:hypothetical protein
MRLGIPPHSHLMLIDRLKPSTVLSKNNLRQQWRKRSAHRPILEALTPDSMLDCPEDLRFLLRV